MVLLFGEGKSCQMVHIINFNSRKTKSNFKEFKFSFAYIRHDFEYVGIC